MTTKHISPTCPKCNADRVTLDQHYGLIPCYSFILVCPNHPADVVFDLSDGEMINLVATNANR